jgi:penicillin V acylase-like amidase (Ntn superfamily)
VSGTPSLTALVINANGTSQWGAHIINNVTIPQGATITSAYVEPYYTSGALDDPNLSLYLENVDSPAALTTTTGDVSGRSLTTGVAWVASAVGTGSD